MKKTALLALFLFFVPFSARADISILNLRASLNAGVLRIVLEGHESVISKGLVYQRGRDILVSFPTKSFAIQSENVIVDYKKVSQDTVLFSPGDFRGLKVFTLKYPDRLVIDVSLKMEKGLVPPAAPDSEERRGGRFRTETIVIDPGHGGYENGIVTDGYREKNTVLDIAKKLSALINSGASRSFLTRGSDRFMTLSERVSFTHSKDPDVFLSLHIGNHSGIVLYVPLVTDYPPATVKPYLDNRGQAEYAEETLTLLQAMKEAMISFFGEDMVSVKPVPYTIMSKMEAASLLIEFPSFNDAVYIEEFNAEIAAALYKGLYIYEEIKTK